jgi:hypothetical protein
MASGGNVVTIDPGGSTYTEAWGINNVGQITGWFQDQHFQAHAYIATPQTQPGCQVDPNDVHLFLENMVNARPTSMGASFTPSSTTLDLLALKCNFQQFDWVQKITVLPDPSPFYLANGTHLTAGSVPFNDPANGGYSYPESQQQPFAGAYPFYYNPASIPFGCAIHTADLLCAIYILPFLGNTLNFFDIPKDPCLSGGRMAFSFYCGNAIADPGAFIQFKTALVGILDNTGKPSKPLYEWTWKDDFNGVGQGGVFGVPTTSSAYPVDPRSGTGGITITNINGVPQAPPTVTCTATPNTLWPPNGKWGLVTVSGNVTPGTSPLVSANYAVIDEYDQIQPSGSIALSAGGSYSFGVSLIAARNGDDQDGRTYTIVVTATDNIGNVGSCSVVVTVPHDQRQ